MSAHDFVSAQGQKIRKLQAEVAALRAACDLAEDERNLFEQRIIALCADRDALAEALREIQAVAERQIREGGKGREIAGIARRTLAALAVPSVDAGGAASRAERFFATGDTSILVEGLPDVPAVDATADNLAPDGARPAPTADSPRWQRTEGAVTPEAGAKTSADATAKPGEALGVLGPVIFREIVRLLDAGHVEAARETAQHALNSAASGQSGEQA